MTVITSEHLSSIIGLIYDAAIDSTRWPMAMEAIRTELGFHNAVINLQKLPSGDVLTNMTTNIPAQYVALMENAGPDVVQQWGGIAVLQSLPLDKPAILTHTNPDFDMATTKNRYALTFAKPQGLIDVMAIGLARDSRGLGSISFGRHEAAGPIRRREIQAAELLIPHLQRAATINRILDRSTFERGAFERTLDLLMVPTLLVDEALRISYANPTARALLKRGDPIRSSKGSLYTHSAETTSELGAAVAQAAVGEWASGRKALGIPLSPKKCSSAYALHVLPLGQSKRASTPGAIAAIFVACADALGVASTELVKVIFNLTTAEARVFEQLAARHSLADTALALGIERSTAKTHLQHICEKMGVHRQVDLIHVAASLAVPI
jgi:DNA-binding CsgD family transcriptional regulator